MMRLLLFAAAAAGAAEALSAGTRGGLDWRYFAAGGISAALSHGYTTPVDVIKTRMQTNPELYNGSLPVALTRILEEEGWLFLFQGLGPTCVGYGVEGALKFGVYELCKPFFRADTEFAGLVAASTLAGAVASVVLCPAEDVRIRLVADPSFANGAFAAIARVAAAEGPLSSFRSFPAMLAKQVPYTMGKQVSFDLCCEVVHSAFAALFVGETLAKADTLTPLVAALPSAVLACVLSHPGDVLLTHYTTSLKKKKSRRVLSPPEDDLVASPSPPEEDDSRGAPVTVAAVHDEEEPTSVVDSFLGIIASQDGVAGFFTGIKARLLHIMGILVIQLVVYDKLKQLLGLPATGH
mmetsp:Transcript_27348/g.83942  ORF Transcript_27348/g.83942 Transcript_27348/m.83942 type:complete len:351 (+) Transcript_27348:73-1125(+)